MFTNGPQPGSLPIHLLHEDSYEAWRETQPPATKTWLQAVGFRGERGKVILLPGVTGSPVGVACGVGKRKGEPLTLWHASGMTERLPDGDYHMATEPALADMRQFALGWAYGQYRFDRFRRETGSNPLRAVRLALPPGVEGAEILRIHAACSLARDLINTPASHLLPEQLGAAVETMGRRFGATVRQVVGEELLEQGFPAIHAVGRASHAAPRLIELRHGEPSHPLVALVGKGVCFDSGGLDIKPPASMLLMKKDMGGAACVLALAQLVMEAALPVRLLVLIPAVENAIGGNAFRPGDVLPTRKGLQVEVGNTDAEGRLVLADGLALADAGQPDLIIDMATLTGAARVALGPELPALFSNDDSVAAELLAKATAECDPLWQLPLWPGYDDELASKVADLNNISASGFSGAIIGALFLQRFVTPGKPWLHLDLYGWNPRERPGRPVGAEAQGVRALYAFLKARYPA